MAVFLVINAQKHQKMPVHFFLLENTKKKPHQNLKFLSIDALCHVPAGQINCLGGKLSVPLSSIDHCALVWPPHSFST